MILWHEGDTETWLMGKDPEPHVITQDWIFSTRYGWKIFTWDEDFGKLDWYVMKKGDKDFDTYHSSAMPADEDKIRDLIRFVFQVEDWEDEDED